MADSLGELRLGLGVDLASLEAGLIDADRTIERYKIKWKQNVNLAGLSIKPIVDDSALTALNKHLSLKQSHLAQVRADFAKPIRATVDYGEVGLLPSTPQVSQVSQRQSLSGQTNNVKIDDNGLANSVKDGVEKGFKAVSPKGILTSVFKGAFEGLGAELFGGFSKSFSSQIDSVLANTIGSKDLLGKKIAQRTTSGIQNVAARIAIDNPIAGEVVGAVSGGVRRFVGEKDIAIEANKRRGQEQRKQDKDLELAREGLTVERQSASEQLDTASVDLLKTKRRLAPIQKRIDRQDAPYQAKLAEIEQKKTAERARLVAGRNAKIQELIDRQSTAATDTQMAAISDRIGVIASSPIESKELVKLDFAAKEVERRRAPIQRKQDIVDSALESKLGNFSVANDRSEAVKRQTKQLLRPEQPKVYQDILDEIAPGLADRFVPKLVSDPSLVSRGAYGEYDVTKNAISLNPSTYAAVKSGKQLTDRQYATLREEAQHSKDLRFGKFEGMQSLKEKRPLNKPVKATPEEEMAIAVDLSGYDERIRPFERDAKLEVQRALPKYKAQTALENITKKAGLSGLSFAKQVFPSISNAGSKIDSAKEQGLGENVPALSRVQSKYNELKLQQKQVFNNIRSAQSGDLLPDEIIKLEGELERYLAQVKSIEQRANALNRFSGELKGFQKGRQTTIPPAAVVPQIVQPPLIDRIGEVMQSGGEKLQSAGALARKVGTPIAQVARNTYGALQGVENAVMPFIPFGQQIKAVGKNVALPAAAYAGIGMLPGGAVAQSMLGGAVNSMLSLPGTGVASAVSGAVGSAFGSLPLIGNALQAGAGTLAAGSMEAMATALTPIVAGKVALQLVSKGAKLALPTAKPKYDYIEIGQSTANKAIEASKGLVATSYEMLPPVTSLPPTESRKSIAPSRNRMEVLPDPFEAGTPNDRAESIPVSSKNNDWKALARAAIVDTRTKLDAAIKAGNAVVADRLLKQFGSQVDEFSRFVSPDVVGRSESITNKGAIGRWQKIRADRAKKIELIQGDDLSPLESKSTQPRQRRNSYQPIPRTPDPLPEIDPGDIDSQLQPLASLSNRRKQQRRYKGSKINQRNILEDSRLTPEEAAFKASQNAASASAEFDRAERLIINREDSNNSRATEYANSFDRTSSPLEYGIDRVRRTVADINPNPLGKLGEIATTTAGAFLAFQGLKFVGGMITSWGDAAVKTALAMETLTIGTKAVSTTNYAAAQSISKSQGLAQKLGFNPLDTLKGVQGFKAATQDTEIQDVSDDIFASAQKYGRLIGQSSESQGRSLIQLQQIGSKASLTYEDVGQLSDSLPGAATKIAQGLGTNTSGLRKLTASGGVSGVEALIGLKQGFDAATATGLDESLGSTTASLGRLEGSLTKLKGALGENLLAPVGFGAKVAGGAIEGLSSNVETFATILIAALVAAGAQGIFFAGKMALAAAGISGLGATVSALAPALATFAGLTVGIYILVEAFKAVNAQFDNTNPMSSYANAAEGMVKRLKAQKGSVDDLGKSLSELATKAADERFNKDRPFLSAVGDAVTSFNRGNKGFRKDFADLGIGKEPETFAEKKTKQTKDSLLSTQVNQATFLKAEPIDLTKFSAEKEKIDLEIKRLNVEQAITPASDRSKLQQIQKALQDQQSKQIEVTSEPIKKRGEYDSIARQAKEVLADPLYVNNPKEQAIAKEQLKFANERSAALDKEISKVRDGLSELAVTLRRASGVLGNSLESINNAKLEREAKFNNSSISPLDTGAKASFQFVNTQADIKARIAAFEISKSDSEKALTNPVAKKQIEQFQRGKLLPKDLTITTDEQLSGIKTDGASETLTDAIKAYRDASKQIKSLSGEAASGSREFQVAIAENARSVRDYNQSLAYNAQRLTIEVQQTENSLQSQDFAGKLRSALAGVSDRFSAYFNSSIDILLESSKGVEIETNRRKAQSQIEEARVKALQDNDLRQEQTKKSLDDGIQSSGVPMSGKIVSPIPGVNLANIDSYNPGAVGLFGAGRDAGPHKGLDFKAPAGTPVMASFDGTAILDKNVPFYGGRRKSKSRVVLEGIDAEGNAIRAVYFHLGEKSWEMFRAGRKKSVKAGDVIGDVGKDGDFGAASVGEHLHYELRRGGKIVDPKKGLAQLYSSMGTADRSPSVSSVKSVQSVQPSGSSIYTGLANFIGKRESNNNYYAKQGGGSFDKSETIGGFPAGRKKQNIGRYQFNKSDFLAAQKSDPSIKDFTPSSQDKIFAYKVKQRAAKQLAVFQSASTPENADKLRESLGQEWEVLRDGKTKYGGLDRRRNFFGGQKSKDEFYQSIKPSGSIGLSSAEIPRIPQQNTRLVNALAPSLQYDVTPPTPLGTGTTSDQQISQIQADRNKLDTEYKVKSQLNNTQAIFAKSENITKLESLKINQAIQDRKLKRQEDDRKLTDKRRNQDRDLTTGYDTPAKVVQRQTVASERTASDTTRDLTRTREDLTFAATAGKKLQSRISAGIKDVSFSSRSPEEQTQIKQISVDLKAQIPQLEQTIVAYNKLIKQSSEVSKRVSVDAKTKAGDRQSSLNTSTNISVLSGLISIKQEQAKTIEIFQKDRPSDFSKGDPLVVKKEIAVLQAQLTKTTAIQSLTEKRRVADPVNQKKIDGEIKNANSTATTAIANANAEFMSAKGQRSIGFSAAALDRQKVRSGAEGTLGTARTELFRADRKANPLDFSKPISTIEGATQLSAEESRYLTTSGEIANQSELNKSQEAHFAQMQQLEDKRHQLQMQTINRSIDLAEAEEQIQGQRTLFDRSQFNTGLALNTNSSRTGLAKADRRDIDAQRIDDNTARDRIRLEYDAQVQTQMEIMQRTPGDPTAKSTFVDRVQELDRKRELDVQIIDTQSNQRDRERTFSQGSTLVGSRAGLVSAGAERASIAGNSFDARNLNYQAGVIQQGQEFRIKQKELEDLQKAGAITVEQFKLLGDELSQLNDIKLDNLARQFDPVTDAIKSVTDKFGGLLNSFTDGGMDAGKSLREFLASPFKAVQAEANKYLTSALSQQLNSWLKPGMAKGVPAIAPTPNLTSEISIPTPVQFIQPPIQILPPIPNVNPLAPGISGPVPVAIVSDTTPNKTPPAAVNVSGGGSNGGFGGSFGDKLTRSAGSTLLSSISSIGSGAGFNPLGLLGGLVSGLFADGGVVGDELMQIPAYADGGIHSPQRFQHGIIPGYSSKDDTLAVVMKGESFLTQAATARLGREGVDALNKGETPQIFMPNFNLGAMPELPKFAEGGIVGGAPNMAAAAISATNFGDNISNMGSSYNFTMNNNGNGSSDVAGTIDHQEIIRSQMMDMLMRLKRQGVIS